MQCLHVSFDSGPGAFRGCFTVSPASPLAERQPGPDLVRPDRLPFGKDQARGGWAAVTGHPRNGAPGPESEDPRIQAGQERGRLVWSEDGRRQ